MGAGRDQVLLLLSMAERDYNLYRYGFGDEALTEYGIQKLDKSFLDAFKKNDWETGFQNYLKTTGELLGYARAGEPLDARNDGSRNLKLALSAYGFFAFVGIIVARLKCSKWKRKMETARTATQAAAYVLPDKIQFKIRSDRFIRRSETRRRIESNSSKGDRHSGNSGGSRGGGSHSGKF